MKSLLSGVSLRWATEILCVAGVYFLSGQLTQHVAIPEGGGTSLWSPPAIALAAGLILGYRAALGVWLGAFLLYDSFLAGPMAVWGAGALASGCALEMLVGTLLIRIYVPDVSLPQIPDKQPSASVSHEIVFFIGLAALASIVSPSVAVIGLKYSGFIEWQNALGRLAHVESYCGAEKLTR